MSRRSGLWLIAAVVVLCYVVPFTALSGVAHWTGSFLFWTLAGLAIIALNFAITSRFGDRDDE